MLAQHCSTPWSTATGSPSHWRINTNSSQLSAFPPFTSLEAAQVMYDKHKYTVVGLWWLGWNCTWQFHNDKDRLPWIISWTHHLGHEKSDFWTCMNSSSSAKMCWWSVQDIWVCIWHHPCGLVYVFIVTKVCRKSLTQKHHHTANIQYICVSRGKKTRNNKNKRLYILSTHNKKWCIYENSVNCVYILYIYKGQKFT